MEPTVPHTPTRTTAPVRNMVATSQPLAVEAGLSILREGGNAVDAVVAAAMALTVVEPCSNGIGSDAFALVWHGDQLHGLNASGRSPMAWSPDRFAGCERMPTLGWDSITVPGAVSAWTSLAERFCTMSLPRLAEPAIHHARSGFNLTPLTGASWARSVERFAGFEEWQRLFAPGGRAPRPGERYQSEDHARTLEEISRSNGESFYRGALASRIIEASAAGGGCMDAEDLAGHEPIWCETLDIPYNDMHLHELPPNGQGLTALVATGILDRFDIAGKDPLDPLVVHLQIEAMKCAFADIKPAVGCPDTMELDPGSLLADEHLDRRAASIDPTTAHDPGHVIVTDASTVYLCATDAAGTMVSYIQSNYMGFGSGVVIPGTGIAMQNRGACFVLEAGHPNEVGGGKRPYHTIIPAFATRNGAPEIAFGVMGGHMQPQGHLQVLSRMTDFNQDPQAALDAPRWRIGEGRRLFLEPGFPGDTIDALAAMGHEIEIAEERSVAFGGGQIIRRQGQGYIGGSDDRRDGLVDGF